MNILVDQQTFEEELRRATGEPVDTRCHPGHHGNADGSPGGRRCHAPGGTRLHPSDAVAAALVGQVRRVVIDAESRVVDLGHSRRLFTGASRDAARIQAALADHDGLTCRWHGCDHRNGLQIDHRRPAAAGGPTDIANSDVLCGYHNRLKEHGYRPTRGPDGTWTIYRPDGTPITPAT